MDLETTQTNTTAKLTILKQGEYEMWRLRIEQYFQVQDYALWDVIEKPTARTTTNADGTSTSMISGPVTTEEKAQKKNDVKAKMVWRNKLDLDTMSIDDLYINFKIVEQEVKRTITSNLKLNQSSQNIAFVSSPSSNNEVNTSNVQVSTANSPVSTANLSDATVYLALLSMRARRYFQRTSKKITINGSDTVGYDKSKIECFNCHKIGHFARECRGPRNQDNRNKNQDSSRRTVNVEETSSKAMVAIDGAGFDWSFIADEEVPTNMALMAFSDLEKNEDMFCDQIAILKRDTSFKDSEINALKSKIEKLKKEKESNQIKINKFKNASKSLDKLIGSQISDNSRKGVGFVSYNVVPPPPTGLFAPPTIDLSNSGLEEFQQPEFEGYGPKTSKSVYKDTSNEVKKTPDAPLGEKLVSEKEKQTIFPTKIESVKQQEKPARKPVNFDHVQAHCNYHQREGMVNGNNYTRVNYNYSAKKAHPNSHRNMTPRAVLMKTGLKPPYTARPVNTTHSKTTIYRARPMSCFSKLAQSTVKRPYQSRTTLTNKTYNQKINTAKEKVYTAKSKAVNTTRPTSVVVNAVRANQVNVVKASACWVWRPTKLNNASITFKRQNYIDARGRSKHMTGNMSYLTDFKEFDGGNVTFRGGAKGGRITSKGTLKISKLDFEDVYFVKGLQFNLFSVSQMCDKKNSVLFTNTTCFVLSPDFKLPNESQVLLKVLRKNNMYNVDMKNIVSKESLTCLVANATLDESMLWHRRLGHINFKTINKLVKDNLVRGLPAKHFENDQIYVACLKGKQHKASCTNSNDFAGLEESNGAGHTSKETKFSQDYIVMPLNAENKDDEGVSKASGFSDQEQPERSTPNINTARPSANFKTGSLNINIVSPKVITTRSNRSQNESDMFSLGRSATLKATHADLFGDEREMDMSNLTTSYQVHTTLNIRIHKDHSLNHVIGDIQSGVQTKGMTKNTNEHGFISAVYEGKTHEDLHTCLFACFLSQEEPKKIIKALSDPAWVEAMQEELLQFKLQKVWILVDLPKGKRAIGTKWIFRNKKDERGIVTRNKARLVAQGYTQEECIDYDEVFAPVARIKAIRLFLAYASFIGFMVYQMDVKSAFLYGGESTVWFASSSKSLVYVDDIIFGSTNKELCTEFEKLMHDKFQMSSMRELNFFLGLQVKQREDGIFISQDKYVAEILSKFGFTDVRTASTPMDIEKPLLKDSNGDDVDVHLYRLMIGSLMYLTSSRPNIMFALCACSRFQVTPKVSHLHAVKMIFRYLKGQPKLGLWYPRNSPFDLLAYFDSDYAGASLDRKSTTGGCQFLGCILISWQCKKQIVVATSYTEAEYVVAASCCGQGNNVNMQSRMVRRTCNIKQKYVMNQIPRKLKRGRDIKIPQSSGPPKKVGDEAVHKELGDRIERAATTASSLEAEQDSGNINRTQSMATLNEQTP
ncbi:putative ribonuclease H-like domain-containing protein [Tanacetum coccineum]